MFQQEKKFDALFLKLKDYPVGDNPDNISNSYKYFFNKIESRYANYVSLSNSLRKEIEKETLSILKELEE